MNIGLAHKVIQFTFTKSVFSFSHIDYFYSADEKEAQKCPVRALLTLWFVKSFIACLLPAPHPYGPKCSDNE